MAALVVQVLVAGSYSNGCVNSLPAVSERAAAHGIKLSVGREIDASRAHAGVGRGAPADQPAGEQAGEPVVVGVGVGVGDPHGASVAVNF